MLCPKGQGVSFLSLQGGHRARCNWRRKDVLVSGGGPLRYLINAAVLSERVVVLAKRDSNGVEEFLGCVVVEVRVRILTHAGSGAHVRITRRSGFVLFSN